MRNELIIRVTLTPSVGEGGAPLQARGAREYRFSKLPIAIGRGHGNDLAIESQFVSTHHARIEEISGTLCVRDLGSRNGVVVLDDSDGTRIPTNTAYPVPRSGFTLQLGNETRLHVEPAAELGSAVRAEAASGPALGASQPAFGDGLPALPDVPRPLRSLPPLDPSSAALELGSSALSLPPLPGRPALEPVPAAARVAAAGAFEPVRAEPRGREPAPPALKTGSFDASPEALALQGLREIVGSLTPGRTLSTSGDIARLITRLHDLLQVLCRSYLTLRDGHKRFVEQLQLQRSSQHDAASVALDVARDPSTVAALLLDFREHAMSAGPALESALREVGIHQVALLDGMMQGVQALLEELAPESIQREAGRDRRGSAEREYWETYCERHARFAREGEALARVFGAEFASAYRAYRRSRQAR
ncbi:MAG TPA: type VI secretion system-associated FHA domain protein [Polyangiaceae bacterium]|nr:type VI secretion system-associated FHA domain protein [Polyangiaceae bacterium]